VVANGAGRRSQGIDGPTFVWKEFAASPMHARRVALRLTWDSEHVRQLTEAEPTQG
jgi:hypothetical protein